MICNSCRRAIISTVRVSRNTRSVATVPATPNAAPVHPPPSIPVPGSPAALSSSRPGISQPLSTPHANAEGRPKTQSPKSVKLPKSSVPGGTELRGIAYLKGKPAVLAKEDDEYPSWLWGLLEEGKMGETKVDLSAMTKKQRQKYDKKKERLAKNQVKQVPLHEQSVDLTQPGDGAEVSLEKRQQITKSSRVARRKGIRENNFLRGV